jgi:hypothetical protein
MDAGFRDRVAVLATMHGKEQVMAPILEQALGLRVVVPTGFNTDQFGTFTRDVERAGTQRQAARKKAAAALENSGWTLAIANEGAFGPHPELPMLPCDRELVLLLDTAQDLEIVGSVLSTQTNYRQGQITSVADALKFAEAVGFPSHGLVVWPRIDHPKADATITNTLTKGIVDPEHLVAVVTTGLNQFPSLQIETDMRALYNPTRMGVIAAATTDLVQTLQRSCPQCHAPGFAAVSWRPGLPCAVCSLPTTLTRSVIYQCQKCHFSQETLYPDGMQVADPGSCGFCNP